jgi:hypothetical protein
MVRWIKCAAIIFALMVCAGCRGEADKDKNKDKDRPKPAEAGKA